MAKRKLKIVRADFLFVIAFVNLSEMLQNVVIAMNGRVLEMVFTPQKDSHLQMTRYYIGCFPTKQSLAIRIAVEIYKVS